MTSLEIYIYIYIYISSHGETRNIKFGQTINLSNTPVQEVLTSLPHNHVALTISLSLFTEGLLLSNLASKKTTP